MSIKVTLEFENEAALVAYFSQGPTVASAKAQSEKQAPKVETPKSTKAEKPAAEPSAQVTKAASTASSDVQEMSADDLTKVIVATVARTSRDQVLAMLREKFDVGAGKEITDPAIRAQAKAALEAM